MSDNFEQQRFEPLLKIDICKRVRENIFSKSNGKADAGISIDFQGYTFDATEYDIDSHKVASNIQLPLASAGEKERLYEDIFNC